MILRYFGNLGRRNSIISTICKSAVCLHSFTTTFSYVCESTYLCRRIDLLVLTNRLTCVGESTYLCWRIERGCDQLVGETRSVSFGAHPKLRSGSIFVALGKPFPRETRNEKQNFSERPNKRKQERWLNYFSLVVWQYKDKY